MQHAQFKEIHQFENISKSCMPISCASIDFKETWHLKRVNAFIWLMDKSSPSAVLVKHSNMRDVSTTQTNVSVFEL